MKKQLFASALAAGFLFLSSNAHAAVNARHLKRELKLITHSLQDIGVRLQLDADTDGKRAELRKEFQIASAKVRSAHRRSKLLTKESHWIKVRIAQLSDAVKFFPKAHADLSAQS
jgi:hypothetical protein